MRLPVAGLCVFLLWAGCAEVLAVTTTEFLASALNDPVVLQEEMETDLLRNAPEDTPYLERVEFRTETDHFDLSRQKYALRFHPRAWNGTRYVKAVHRAACELQAAERDLEFHRALKQRCLIIADFIHADAVLRLKRKMGVLFEDRKNVLEATIASTEFDINDLIAVQSDMTGLQLEILEQEDLIAALQGHIRALISDTIGFHGSEMVGVEQIEQIVRTLTPVSEGENVYLKNAGKSTTLAHNRYHLSEAEKGRVIDYLKVTYDNEQREDPDDAFFLEVGVRLPWVKSGAYEKNRTRLGYIREKAARENLRRTLSEKQVRLPAKLRRLIAQYRILKEKQENGGGGDILKTYSGMPGADPLALLRIEQDRLETGMAREKRRHEIYCTYIALLDISGRLSMAPVINPLSPHQELLFP